MSIKSILMNTEEVRATLDGRKTVTRRVVKPQPDSDFMAKQDKSLITAACAPYRPGDILYVREMWCRFDCCRCEGDTVTGQCLKAPDAREGCYMYRATNEIAGDVRWHSSVCMPREAARIWLRVTDVRVERLQDITSGDCLREGIPYCVIDTLCVGFCDSCGTSEAPQRRFQRLWDSTIKPADRERYCWAANPWVWVVAFERCGKPEEG